MRQKCWTTLTSTCVLFLQFVHERRGFKGSSNKMQMEDNSYSEPMSALDTYRTTHLRYSTGFHDLHELLVKFTSSWYSMLCLKMYIYIFFMAFRLGSGLSFQQAWYQIGSGLLEIWFLWENNHRENCCSRQKENVNRWLRRVRGQTGAAVQQKQKNKTNPGEEESELQSYIIIIKMTRTEKQKISGKNK